MSEESKTEGETPEPLPLPEGVAPDTEDRGASPNVGDGAETELDKTILDGAEPLEPTPTPIVAGPLTGERVLDRTLGAAILTSEAIDHAVQRLVERTREMQEQAPAFWAQAEERGRPVRQNLLGTWADTPGAPVSGPTGSVTAPVDLYATETDVLVEEDAEPVTVVTDTTPSVTSGIANSLRNLGSSLGILGGGAKQSAEDEIRTLESRVRELEQVVASGTVGVEPAPEPVELETVTVTEEETPADSATYVPGTYTHEEALADSPYAVSETEEEQQAEATTPAEETPAPSTSTPKGRKKQREFDPEPVDGTSTSSLEESES